MLNTRIKRSQVVTRIYFDVGSDCARRCETNVDRYFESHKDLRDEAGKRVVVKNGVGPPRSVTTGAASFEVQAQRVTDQRKGEGLHPVYICKVFRRFNLSRHFQNSLARPQ